MFDEPIFFKPLMFERVWGGNHLEALYRKPIPLGKIIGESWEVCDRPEAQSIVDGGAFDGWTLRQLIEKHPREILGNLPDMGRFPLLIKYVDAGDKLSVQVHPDDAGAKQFNDLGKSECWVVVKAEPGAQIVRGLKPETTREAFERAVAENRVEELLHYFEPKVGDVVALPAGMVHAIGKGLVVAEVQQNSDVTLRIHDYNRMGLDGKPRKLHIKEAMEAIRFDDPGHEFEGNMRADTVLPATRINTENGGQSELLLCGDYFDLIRMSYPPDQPGEEKTEAGHVVACSRRFKFAPKGPMVVMILDGTGTANRRAVKSGTTFLVPAALKSIEIEWSGGMTFLLALPK